MYFWLRPAIFKIELKCDRIQISCSVYIVICSFWCQNASIILDFWTNRKLNVFLDPAHRFEARIQFGQNRICALLDIEICSFWHRNASAIIIFLENRKRMYFCVRSALIKFAFKFGRILTCRSVDIEIAKLRPLSWILDKPKIECIFGSGLVGLPFSSAG